MRAIWRRIPLAVVALCAPALALAGEPGRIELGVVPFDVSVISANGETEETVSAPAGGFFTVASQGVYLQFLATDKIAIEPQASLTALFHEDDNLRRIQLSLRANYLFAGADRPSAYVSAGGGLTYAGLSGSDSETDPLIGLGVGYRHPVRSAGSVRVELGYQRVFSDSADDALNVFSFRVGLGLRF
jgi:hypothetical protein